jgi:hypothetical protein
MKGIWKENGKWWQFSMTSRGYTIKPYIRKEDKKIRNLVLLELKFNGNR